ncbi:MAG: lysylphosphatidylglycerol synthase transmembrane domain-containing protein [Gemmatimonadales bacterium]
MSTSSPATSPPVTRRRQWIVTAVIMLVTVVLLYWVLRNTSFADIAAHLRQARPIPVIAAVVLASLSFPIRAIRWQLLLRRPAPDDAPVGLGALWHATAIGFMANNTLPLRLGEVARSYAVSRLGQVSMASALSSIAVERALDLLTLVGLLAVALASSGLPAETVVLGSSLRQLAFRAAALCGLIFVGALLVLLFTQTTERVIRRLVPSARIAERLVNLVEALRIGLQALRHPARMVAAAVWSALLWLVLSASFYVAFPAFGIEVGFAGALLVQVVVAFGVAVPSTPGYVGVFELAATAALALFGVPADRAIAYGVTYHVTTFLPIVLLGLWSLVRTGLSLREASALR